MDIVLLGRANFCTFTSFASALEGLQVGNNVSDLTRIEAALTEARDALREYWEQGEGAACFIGLQVADDALRDFHEFDAAPRRDTAHWQRLESLAGEVERLRAPLG